MSYIIRKTNGTTLGTILDGTLDTAATSLSLVGRNYSNYGQVMTDNLVSMVENFAYNISPSNPLAGQLWYDTGTSRLKVYTGTQFKNVGSCQAEISAPITTVAGDLWWDTIEEQLYVYNGTTPYAVAGWILVGPKYKKTKGISTAQWEQITDSLSTVHDVVSIYLNGTRTAIISRDSEFTPQTTISGFTTIKTGHNLSSAQTLWGTANNASYLGGVPAANYLRADANDTTTGSLGIINDSGLTVGAGSDLTLTVSGTTAEIRNVSLNSDIVFYTNISSTDTAVLTVDGSTGKITVASDPTTNLGIATKQYVDNSFVDSVLGGVPTTTTMPALTANTSVATTEFVIHNSGFLKNKIYDGGNANVATTFFTVVDTGTGYANLAIDDTSVLTATSDGVNLLNGATAVTQTDSYLSSGNARVATTQFVKTATQWWDGSAKFVSTDEPEAGVNDAGSNDGDFWFQREA